MQIIYDKKNKEFADYFQHILNSDLNYNKIKNLAIKIKNNKVELINYNYKKEVSISVDFFNEDNKNNISLKKIFKNEGSSILDCTAGFGRDGFILASLGFNVTMIERNPIITLLLRNGIKRSISQVKNNLCLLYGDSYEYLKTYNDFFDYIYIDFMFKKIKNTSLSSKYDEVLKILANDKKNRIRLLEIAKEKCKNKVIVKGSKNLNSITGVDPDYSVKTNLVRYDIFLSKIN
ncbi:MAG: class I SAM-dependent methyltransferase [Pseudomonadota bacterium]|nr:class I SAM-dependent methyltransferase [Pseudomonadota bacterium]